MRLAHKTRKNINIGVKKAPGAFVRLTLFSIQAKFLKIENTLGSIDLGKIADLLIVSGKPDQNIDDIKNVELVFRNGIGYDSKALRESVKGLVGRH